MSNKGFFPVILALVSPEMKMRIFGNFTFFSAAPEKFCFPSCLSFQDFLGRLSKARYIPILLP